MTTDAEKEAILTFTQFIANKPHCMQQVTAAAEKKRLKMLRSFGISPMEPVPEVTDNATQALGFMQLIPLLSICPKDISRDIEEKTRKDILLRKQISVRL